MVELTADLYPNGIQANRSDAMLSATLAFEYSLLQLVILKPGIPMI